MAEALAGQRKGDRVRARQVRVRYLERKCAAPACGDWFEVKPNRPDADYCPSNACKKRRQYARKKAKAKR